MGKHKIALDIYELGTRKVPSSDSNIMVYAHSCLRLNGSSANQVFQLLRGQHEKLARQLTPPKAIDPLQMLPLELAEMTIRYLEFRHIVSALPLSSLRSLLILSSGLLRVSKTWLQLLVAMPGLWSDLDFSTTKRPVNLGAVRKYIKRGNGTTTRVTLDRFGSNAEKIPRYIATRCRGLRDLRISGGLIGASILEAVPCASNLKTLIISKACQISCDVVSQLLSHCPNLECAEFQSVSPVENRTIRWEADMPKLRTLTLDAPKVARRRGSTVLALETLLTKIPNIRTLSVQGWVVAHGFPAQCIDFSNLHQLQQLDISRLNAILPPRLPSTIHAIAMADCNCFPGIQGVDFADFDLPEMTRLSLAGWPGLSPSDLQACLLPSKGKVTHLDIGGCITLSSASLKELITQGYLEAVEDLVLRSCNVDDEIAMLIARNLPRLENLDFACSKITGVGVKALVIGLEGKLKHLCLDGCHSTNIDAVEFARAMGVKVAFGFPDPLSGGRRVRQR